MNKSILLLVCFISIVFASSPSLEAANSLWVGYTTLSMGEINKDYLEADANMYESMGYSTTLTKFSGGLIAGADIGPLRLGYILPTTGKVGYEELGYKYDIGFECSLMMALIGTKIPLGSAKSGSSLGIYVGSALASANLFMTASSGLAEIKMEFPFGNNLGEDIIGEAILGLDLGGVNLNIGYRYAVIQKVALTKDVAIDLDDDGVPDITMEQGEVFEKSGPNPWDPPVPVAFDYSGITVTLSLKFGGEKPDVEQNQFYGFRQR